MKPTDSPPPLSRRERQIMNVIWRRGQATAAEIRDEIENPPSYSGVRALLRILVEKGHLEHEHDGPRYVYRATVPTDQARDSALRHLMATFFDGSAEQAVAALLDLEQDGLSPEEYDRLSERIEEARREGR